MILETYEALKARLGETRWPVHPTALITPQDELVLAEYWLLTPPVPDDQLTRYMQAPAPDGAVEFDIDVKAVGWTPEVVLLMVGEFRRLFSGHRLSVPGRANDPARTEASKVELDRSVKPGLWSCDLGVIFTSRKGSDVPASSGG